MRATFCLVPSSRFADRPTAAPPAVPNPFEALFGKPSDEGHSASYTTFLRDLFASAPCDVGVFLDRGAPPPPHAQPGLHHLFLPFHGGSDDRAALELCTQLAKGNKGISVTVLVLTRAAQATEEDREADGEVTQMESTMKKEGGGGGGGKEELQFTVQGGGSGGEPVSPRIAAPAGGETVYPTQHDLESSTADTIALDHAKSLAPTSVTFLPLDTISPLRTSLRHASSIQRALPNRFTWVIGRGRRDAASHRVEGLALLRAAEAEGKGRLGACRSAEVRRCLGQQGTAALVSGVGDNLLIVQSRATGGWREGKGGGGV